PKAHEVWEGNRQDRSTVKEMLASLEKRTGKQAGSTVVVDRGMGYDENLEDWEELLRTPSPRNPDQKKSLVRIKRRQKGEQVYILCLSEGREAKDRAIREKQEQRLLADLEALKTRIEKGHLKN